MPHDRGTPYVHSVVAAIWPAVVPYLPVLREGDGVAAGLAGDGDAQRQVTAQIVAGKALRQVELALEVETGLCVAGPAPADGRELQAHILQRLGGEEVQSDQHRSARLGDVATLLGATFQPPLPYLQPATAITVTLVWRAEAETATSYRVFLYLVGPEGGIVAQLDGEPANWTRPTTGWLPGEVVLDKRVLQIPASAAAGEYVLWCGLYDLATGTRLSGPDGSDAVPLARLTVQTP
jgi:hypothetical protein